MVMIHLEVSSPIATIILAMSSDPLFGDLVEPTQTYVMSLANREEDFGVRTKLLPYTNF